MPRVLVADGRHGLRSMQTPLPALGTGLVRVATAVSLVSPGTELHYLEEGRRTDRRFPLGYCSAGTVIALGPGVAGLAVGERVIAMGWGHAVHGDVVTVPYRLCRPVPDGVAFEDAVVATIAATAVHAVDRAQLNPGDEVLVVGAGLVGQIVAQIATVRAATVRITDRSPQRLRSAGRLGVEVIDPDALACPSEPVGRTRRCAFLCITGDGTEAVLRTAHWAARGEPRATLVAVGRFSAQVDFTVDLGNLDIRYSARCGTGYRDDSYTRGTSVVRAPEGEGTVDENLSRALNLIAAGVIRPQAMTITTHPVEDAAAIYTRLRDRRDAVSARFTYGGRA